jgi:hypothetical protein
MAVDLPLDLKSPGRARERLEPFRRSFDKPSFIDLRLLVSELVVEALKAEPDARDGSIELRAAPTDDRVRVEVSSAAYRLPSRQPKPGDVGWGLFLVARLSKRWGFRRDSERATVWLDMPLNSPG